MCVKFFVCYTEQSNELSVDFIVSDDLSEFREVPSVPFLDSHAKSIDVLVELFENSDTVDNWLILSLDIELNTISTPAVS